MKDSVIRRVERRERRRQSIYGIFEDDVEVLLDVFFVRRIFLVVRRVERRLKSVGKFEEIGNVEKFISVDKVEEV